MRDTKETPPSILSGEAPEDIAQDIFAIARIQAVPALLDVLCDITGMGFAAVARVSDASWTLCAVKDKINFGLKVGDQLPLESTLCIESKRNGEPIIIDHASRDPRYCSHHTPRAYKLESYISVPIILSTDHYFGNLCAIDPAPAIVSAPPIGDIFKRFASLIAIQLANEDMIQRANSRLQAERAASELRELFIAEVGETFISPVRAIRDASDAIDSTANDRSALKGLATRIRTNALKMSSLLERMLDFSRPRHAAGLRPTPPPATRRTDDSLIDLTAAPSGRADRNDLDSMLMQRVGELRAHLGRYDMYALTITRWLEEKVPGDSSAATLTIGSRGAWIRNRLQLLAAPKAMLAEFEDINGQLVAVLTRQEISARNTASIASLRGSSVRPFPKQTGDRDWYDLLAASNEDVGNVIYAIEKNIMAVSALYLRLAAWAGQLSLLA